MDIQELLNRTLLELSGTPLTLGTIATFDRLIYCGFLLVGAAVALANVGLDLSALFATGTVAAVAVAFALQNTLQNASSFSWNVA